MQTIKLQATVTALESIAHSGGERMGTVTLFRREKRVQPDQTVEEVPGVSGNGMRGLLRRLAMLYFLDRLGYSTSHLSQASYRVVESVADAEDRAQKAQSHLFAEDIDAVQASGLSLKAFYFLFSGGRLDSTGEHGLNLMQARRIQELIPAVGLLGGAIGNMAIPGKINVGKLTIMVRETAHLLPFSKLWVQFPTVRAAFRAYINQNIPISDSPPVQISEQLASYLTFGVLPSHQDLRAFATNSLADPDDRLALFEQLVREPMPSMWDRMQTEMTTRRDDTKNPHLAALLTSDVRQLVDADIMKKRQRTINNEPKEKDEQSQQMMMQHETVASGTLFDWECVLRDCTPIELAVAANMFHQFSMRPYVGMRQGTGHGKVAINFHNTAIMDSRLVQTGTEIDLSSVQSYERHLSERASDIRSFLDAIR